MDDFCFNAFCIVDRGERRGVVAYSDSLVEVEHVELLFGEEVVDVVLEGLLLGFFFAVVH